MNESLPMHTMRPHNTPHTNSLGDLSHPAAQRASGAPVRVSIVVKALNEGPRIYRALASALAAVAEVGGEVILADSGSTDETIAEATRLPVRIVQLADPRERRCGIGPELGWRHAHGEYVYLMDGDMTLDPGFLSPALAFLARHPEVAGVGGRVLERNLTSIEYRERERRAREVEAHRRAGPVDRLDGGGLYRRVAIAEVGYLSDRNLHSYEELDLALRLRSRGWRLWRLPLDATRHEGHAAPALRLLWRRWQTGYACGCGEVLRAALGQPWWRLLRKDMRELRLYLAVLAWWLALAAVFAIALALALGVASGGREATGTILGPNLGPMLGSVPLPPPALAWSALAWLAITPWAVMTLRRRSARAGLYAVASWCVHAAGLLRGLLADRRPPRAPIAAHVIRPGPQAMYEPQMPAPRTQAGHGGRRGRERTILVACPWTPVGGGMFKVADYLIRAQADPRQVSGSEGPPVALARLKPLDTRGSGSSAASLLVLVGALAALVRGRIRGEVAGVHVNMAERLSLVRKGLVVVTCRALGLPVVLHLHAAELHRAWPALPAPARALARWMFSLPRACIVLGPQSAEFVTGALRVPPERVVAVSNGVPPPRQARRRRERDGLQLLFVGNLSARKGLPELLQAMALPVLAALPITLTLAGGGDLPGWRARADRLGLGDRVRFCGWTDGAKLAGLMASADALVLPSHDEGLPLVILEALAQGLPVVCTPVGEIAACLQDGRHALFVPPGDAVGLARALARLLGDATLREQLALEGRSLWQREFSISRFFSRIAAVHSRCFGACASLPVGPEEGRPMRAVDTELAGPLLPEAGEDRRSDTLPGDVMPGDVLPGDVIRGKASWSGGVRPSASPGAAA